MVKVCITFISLPKYLASVLILRKLCPVDRSPWFLYDSFRSCTLLSDPCQGQYTFLQGKCYRFSANHSVSWLDARLICQRERGDLAHIGNETEIMSLLQWLHKGRTSFIKTPNDKYTYLLDTTNSERRDFYVLYFLAQYEPIEPLFQVSILTPIFGWATMI